MNPFLGLSFIAIGAFSSGSFYLPYKKVNNWAWEIYWLAGGVFSWIIVPWFVASLAVPDLLGLLSSLSMSEMLPPFLFGILWGIGGLTFGLSMRYLGMSLGNALALGLTAVFSTLVPPIFKGIFGSVISTTSGQITLIGVIVSLIGIALSGYAGMQKDKEMSGEQKQSTVKDFNFKLGFWVAVFSGLMSACFAFGLESGGKIAELAAAQGASPLFRETPVYIIILTGGFLTNAAYCLFLAVKNNTISDFIKTANTPAGKNYFFSAIAGTMWYLQFMFLSMGRSHMGKYDFASWTILFSLVIVFSTMWGFISNEWKGSSSKTLRLVILGLAVLILSTVIIGIGNYIQQG